MHARHFSPPAVVRWIVLLSCLAVARPAVAQDAAALQTLRGQYDAMMADFERLAASRGDTAAVEQTRRGRDAMRALTDEQLGALYSRTRVPDMSVAGMATRYLATRAQARAPETAGRSGPLTAGFPDPIGIPAGCTGVNIDPEERYALLIIKEVANSILAAAAWVCNEDILGTNGSLACVPLAIAADVANGFFNTATFCAGEVTANQVDANFKRLDHLHSDLTGGITTIVNTSNTNTTAIINNANTNTSAIVANASANTIGIISNDNVNRATIVANDNTNTATILTNANANKNELRDLILRTQIEADLAMVDGAAVAALYEMPNAQGGYLDLVMAIVTETIANVQAAGGGVGNGASILSDANAAKAVGSFKTAYALYRRAYKAAGK